MAEGKQKILIVEDDLDVADMLNAYFRVQGYEIFTVNWGEDGVRACQTSRPDIVILDIRLPDIDGYEVARRLRSNRRTAGIPIIFLTEKRDRSERLQGLELGADDYITKPFDVQELRLRIRNALRRAEQDTLTNPVTGLPDGKLVDERISECLNKITWTMLIVSLENLDIFRESYGFVASDDVMRAVSLMIQSSAAGMISWAIWAQPILCLSPGLTRRSTCMIVFEVAWSNRSIISTRSKTVRKFPPATGALWSKLACCRQMMANLLPWMI